MTDWYRYNQVMAYLKQGDDGTDQKMTDVRQLKTIAAYMVSDPDTWSDGLVVAAACYELLRLRHFMSQVPDDIRRNFTYVSGIKKE